MSKLKAFLLIIIIAPLIAGSYGIIHNQFTYTISPEYYTKFKFYQFGLLEKGMISENMFHIPRIQVAIVGFMATWWFGLIIGFILGLIGLTHQNGKKMFFVTVKSIFMVIITTLIMGLLGLLYGKFYLADIGVNWWKPDNLIDIDNYIAVGSMHNFGYLGGLIGMIIGIIYSIRMKRKNTKMGNK